MSIIERVRHIMEQELGVAAHTVVEGTRLFEELGADSLDLVELIMAVEEEFDIDITDEEGEAWQTVGDIVRYLEGLDLDLESEA